MRIVIDLQACQNGSRHRGIGRYAMAMTKSMIRADRGHEFRIVVSTAFPDTIGAIRRDLEGLLPQENILAIALPERAFSGDPTNAWRTRAAEIVRARFLDGLAPDLLFIPTLFEGFWDQTIVSVEPAPYPVAVTMYDLIPLDYPEVYLPFQPGEAAYLRKLCNVRDADLLLPISDFIEREVIDRLALMPARVVSVPLGVEPMFRPIRLTDAGRSSLKERYDIVRPFVLNTSPLEFRKNLEGLIAGFAAISPTVRDTHQLVIVGRLNESQRQCLGEVAAREGLTDDALVLPGFISDEDLIALYGECQLFVFPSISEGFGLPVVEAMACGAPVVGSSTTSIPEVIGRSDLLFDPTDPAEMAQTMERVLTNPDLRTELSAFGLDRAAKFTWERAAGTALDAFERICASHVASHVPQLRPTTVQGRPTAAFVAASMDLRSRAGLHNLAMIDALATFYKVTLICAGARTDDPWTRAIVDVRSPAWFERAAPQFDQIAYSVAGRIEPWFPALAASFPGALIVLDGTEQGPVDPRRSQRDIFMARGFPGLLDWVEGRLSSDAVTELAGAELRATTLGTILVTDDPQPDLPGRWLVPMPEAWSITVGPDLPARFSPPPRSPATVSALRDALAAIQQMHFRDPIRELALALPAAVGGAVPDGVDLALVATAVACNEAHDRPQRILIDLTGLDSFRIERLTAEARTLLSALLHHAGPDVCCVAASGERFATVNTLVGELLGLNPCDLPERPVPCRPGDRLIGFDLLGSFPHQALSAMRVASEAGVGLTYGLVGDHEAIEAAGKVLDWARKLPVSMINRLNIASSSLDGERDDGSGPDIDNLHALLDAGVAFNLILLDSRPSFRSSVDKLDKTPRSTSQFRV